MMEESSPGVLPYVSSFRIIFKNVLRRLKLNNFLFINCKCKFFKHEQFYDERLSTGNYLKLGNI